MTQPPETLSMHIVYIRYIIYLCEKIEYYGNSYRSRS